ncbi:MAG: hypothetical protein VCA38_19890 [Roseibacillus sp.]
MLMKCPRCVQRVHRSARQCPHCGFGIADVDRIFGEQDVRLKCLTDAAGVLKKNERVAARRMLSDFQRKFPQLFFGLYFGTFKELPSLRQFGFWLLNRGAFEDVEVSRPNEAGILLSIDVSGKAAGITFGYALQPFLDDEVTFKALSAAHPYFLQGQWLRASEVVVKRITKTLAKQARRAKRDPEAFEPAHQPETEGVGEILERIRANHRTDQSRTQV